MAVGNGENPHQTAFHHVGDMEREYFEIHPAVVFSQSRQRWIHGDPIQAANDLAVESPTQSRLLVFVVFNLGRELGIRFGMKFDSHGWKPASIFRFTEFNGTPLTAPERSSRSRRAISSSQAVCSSAADSVAVSERSKRMRASFSRSGAGNSAASCVTSVKVFDMRQSVPQHRKLVNCAANAVHCPADASGGGACGSRVGERRLRPRRLSAKASMSFSDERRKSRKRTPLYLQVSKMLSRIR